MAAKAHEAAFRQAIHDALGPANPAIVNSTALRMRSIPHGEAPGHILIDCASPLKRLPDAACAIYAFRFALEKAVSVGQSAACAHRGNRRRTGLDQMSYRASAFFEKRASCSSSVNPAVISV